MLNHIALMGRLVRDPELRHTQSGLPVTTFSIACERDFKDADGEKPVDFIDIVAWRNTADFEYERTMEAANRRLFGELTTVVLFTPAEVADIASSTVRELLAFGRAVDEFMPRGIRIENYL